MIGKRVKLVYVHDMSPMVVWDLIGEHGVVTEKDRYHEDIWLVVFDNGTRLWSRKKYLEVIDD